jgi:hypothetical protein
MKKLFFLFAVGFGLLSACKNENSAVRDEIVLPSKALLGNY